MVKPKRKLSRVVMFGVTTHTMCFNCYGQSGSIKPYQRLAKRRNVFRFRSKNGFPFGYRLENSDKKHIIVEKTFLKSFYKLPVKLPKSFKKPLTVFKVDKL